MAITTSGSFFEDLVNGQYFYGLNGSFGEVTVNGGSSAVLGASDGSMEPILVVGLAGSNGNATVTGLGSSVQLVSNGNSNSGARAIVGDGFGSVSVATVSAGALFSVVDTAGAAGSGQTGGSESIEIGTNGGNGTLNVDDSDVVLQGTSTFFYAGVGGGTGAVNLTNNSTLLIENTSGGTTEFSGLNVGTFSSSVATSTGTFSITDSAVDIVNNTHESFLNVGRGGDGALSLDNSTIAIESASWTGFNFGRNSGTADVDMTNGSLLSVNSDFATYFSIGREFSTAIVDIDASTLRLTTTGAGEAGGSIGRDADGFGTVNVTNGGLIEILNTGAGEIYLNIGRSSSASGTGTSAGTVNLTDSTLTLNSSGSAGGAFLNVGRDGSIGNFNADNSVVTVSSANDFATFRVGMDFGTPGAVGTAILENGTDVTVSGDTARVSVGYSGTSTGNLQVLSGSQIEILDTGTSSEGSVLAIGYLAGATASGSMVIDGVGSRVFGADVAIVGYQDPDGVLTGTGDGLLTITNGGELEADLVSIADGGSLILGDSTIEVGTTGTIFGQTAGFYLANGNMRVLADGTANITGNLTSIGTSTLTIEVSSDGTSAGLLNISGDFFADEAFNFTVETLGGYQYATGDSYVLMRAEDFDLNGNLPVVTGQSSDFAHYFYINGSGVNEVNFTALNNGDGTGAAEFDFLDYTSEAAELEYDTDERAGFAGNSDTAASQDIGGAVLNVNRFDGTNKADTLTAFGSGNIELWGRGGTDVITSGAGDDILNGGSGNDTLDGGLGGDTLDGGSNGLVGDTVTYANSNGAVNVRLFQDTATGGHANGDELDNIENLIGSVHNDILFGDVQDNDLQGGDGEDNLNGSNGDDTLNGGADDDRLTGGQGADDLDGGDGTGDEARYATSNEAVVIDLAADTATGGHADGDELDNIENLFGSGFNDTLTGDSQDNRLDGFNGNDTLVGGDGADFLFGGTGSDTADYTDSGMTAVTVKLNTFSGVGGTAEGDELRAIENVIGSAAGDTINGSTGTNTLTGAGGDDTLNGLNGNDFLYGGDNDDTLIGGRGGDLIDGGDGIDTARYANSDGLIRIDLGAGTTGGAGHAFNDTLVDIENIFGSAFNDVITGDDGVNDLNGYNGNDRLNGGLGDDVLTGGSGNDRFVFTDLAFGQDTITDFTNGQDKLDFTALGLTASDFTITQVGNDTLMTLNSDTNQTIVLEDTTATTIDNGDFF